MESKCSLASLQEFNSGTCPELDKARTNHPNPVLLQVGQYFFTGVNDRLSGSRCKPNGNLYIRQQHQATAWRCMGANASVPTVILTIATKGF